MSEDRFPEGAEDPAGIPRPRSDGFDSVHRRRPAADRDSDTPAIEPIRLPPLLPRRQNPWLVVEVDGSRAAHGALVWALREAARRDATVVAVGVVDGPEGDLGDAGRPRVPAQLAAYDRLTAQVLRAIAETGVHGRARTTVVDRTIFEALTAATRGADLVLVRPHGKTLLRQAVPRGPSRRLARGA